MQHQVQGVQRSESPALSVCRARPASDAQASRSSACAPSTTISAPRRCCCERRYCKARSQPPGLLLRGHGQARPEMPSVSVSRSMPRPVRDEMTSWQMSACGKPKPDAFSTIWRCSSVGSNRGIPPPRFLLRRFCFFDERLLGAVGGKN